MKSHTAQHQEEIERKCIDSSAKLAIIQYEYKVVSERYRLEPSDSNHLGLLQIAKTLNSAWNECNALNAELQAARKNEAEEFNEKHAGDEINF